MSSQKSRQRRRVFAWVLLVGSLIGWPVSIFWLAKTEPPFVLSLSWLALVLTAYDILTTTQVYEEQGEDDDQSD